MGCSLSKCALGKEDVVEEQVRLVENKDVAHDQVESDDVDSFILDPKIKQFIDLVDSDEPGEIDDDTDFELHFLDLSSG